MHFRDHVFTQPRDFLIRLTEENSLKQSIMTEPPTRFAVKARTALTKGSWWLISLLENTWHNLINHQVYWSNTQHKQIYHIVALVDDEKHHLVRHPSRKSTTLSNQCCLWAAPEWMHQCFHSPFLADNLHTTLSSANNFSPRQTIDFLSYQKLFSLCEETV